MTGGRSLTEQEWLSARRLGVTGTDIGVIMGLSPYKKRKALLQEKMGRGKPFYESLAVKAGRRLEPLVANAWSARNQIIVTQGLFTASPENRCYIGTPDFLTPDRGLEIKTAGAHIFANGCPKHYEMQCRWYAMITGRDRWDLSCCIVPKDRAEINLSVSDEDLYQWVKDQPHQEYTFYREPIQEALMRDWANEFLTELKLLRGV